MNNNQSTEIANSKTQRFKQLLYSPELTFLMEAHNGLSAKIVENAGFEAIWASGLSISSAFGVRDSNEVSLSKIMDVFENMVDATHIPILVDGDTGHGNFNNVRILIKKLCKIGIAALCIEDKLFPKTNSFVEGKQTLADINEFCGKIKAAKDSQTDKDFCVIARTEALIAGVGIDEALKRADAYHNAGADGILIHSKSSNADEIFLFTKHWQNRCPVVIVPTKYYQTPIEKYKEAGISIAIWANHNMRASISAMQKTCQRIFQEKSLISVEKEVASLEEVFSLLNYKELAEAEKIYLP